MKYLLDSDMLIYFLNHQEPGYSLITKLITQKENIAISVLSLMEVRAGLSSEAAEKYIPLLHDLFIVKPITPPIAEHAGRLRYEYTQTGKKLKPIDLLIASTAIDSHSILITNNKKDFPMPELKLYPE